MDRPTIGIVGCGAIGRAILTCCRHGALGIEIAGVSSRTEASARTFLETLSTPQDYLSRAELIEKSDMLVEAAGPTDGSRPGERDVRCGQRADGD